jgi:hypothetical protein
MYGSAAAERAPGRRHASASRGSGLLASLPTWARPGSPGFARNALVGGLAVLLVLAGIGAVTGLFSGDDPKDAAHTGPQATAGAQTDPSSKPLYPDVKLYRDSGRGLQVNVPKDWAKSSGGTYVDFISPDTHDRKVRINVENAGGSAADFLRAAESRLKRSPNCTGYHQVALNDGAQLSGKAGAELEYTCGAGDTMRHGIWRAIVVDGHAIHFYLSVPDTAFDDSKVVYSEMVRSFSLVA